MNRTRNTHVARRMSAIAAAASISGLLPVVSDANTIRQFNTIFNTDWTVAATGGLRDLGSGSIALNGVSGTVSKAYLYWHGPTNSSNPAANANVRFNGNDVVGQNIGFSDDNFWNSDNSQAYRANVTSLVSGNGTYTLDNFLKNDANINGASLVTFFDDGDASNNRDVVLFDGNDANFENDFDAEGWNIALENINYSGGEAFVSFGVSDGQDFRLGDDGIVSINGTAFTPEDLFDGESVPRGDGGVANGGLWDVVDLDVSDLLAIGNNTLNITQRNDGQANGDALSAIHIGIDLPAGAAPPAIPLPASVVLLASGLAGLAGLRRRRKSLHAS